MDLDLRTIILTIGLLVIVGIIVDGLRRKRKVQSQVRGFEESVLTQPDPFARAQPEQGENDIHLAQPKEAEVIIDPHDIISITVLPESGELINGRALNAAFQHHELKFGAKRIYHAFSDNRIDGKILFSVASLSQPGTFEPNKWASNQYKGLVFFMMISRTSRPMEVLDHMIATASQISSTLQCRLCDSERGDLTIQSIEHYRQIIRDYQRKWLARERA